MHLKDRGFTLIELLVVISIIGLMSSVVLSSLSSARAKARDARKIQEFSEIRKALTLYYDANGQYPTPASNFIGRYYTQSSSFSDSWSSALEPLLSPHIATLPQNTSGTNSSLNPFTFWGTDSAYSYFTDSTGSRYQLFTRFEMSNPLRCSSKGYTAAFTYWSIYPSGSSFCSGGNAVSNANLYVVSSD